MIKGIIFDCDGVIIDSEKKRWESFQRLFMERFDVKLPKKKELKIIGRTEEVNMKYFLKRYKLKGNVEELIERKKEILEEIFSKEENMIPIKGLFKLIRYLKENQYRTAVASSSLKSYVDKVLKTFKIKDNFEEIIYGDMIKKSKPEPDIFLLAAKKLGLKNYECAVIEDSVPGVIAAKKAKMKCIAITSTFSKSRLLKSGADYAVDSLDKIDVKIL